jgi:hypothetical protein
MRRHHHGDFVSNNWLIFVPCDPQFHPREEDIAVALNYLRELAPRANDITVESDGSVNLFHAGSNFETVSCPTCGAKISREGWIAALEEAWESRFEDLSIITPCCSSDTSLNDLNYDMPMAFGRFALELSNRRIGHIPDVQRKRLEQILKTPLKIVWKQL